MYYSDGYGIVQLLWPFEKYYRNLHYNMENEHNEEKLLCDLKIVCKLVAESEAGSLLQYKRVLILVRMASMLERIYPIRYSAIAFDMLQQIIPIAKI